MTTKEVFKMTISEMRDAIDSASHAEIAIMAAEVGRRISKRNISGKPVTKKYHECLQALEARLDWALVEA